MPQAMIVYNPISGRFPKEPFVNRAAMRLDSLGWEVEVYASKSPQHVTRLAQQASRNRFSAFFVAGGDGSIGLAIKGLINSETALGVLPAGTSNVWAKQFHLAGLTWHNLLALEQAAGKQVKGQVQSVDVGFVNDQPFLMWAGVGLDAHVVHQMEGDRKKIRRFAKLRYAQTILKDIQTWKGIDLQIEVDGKQINGHYILAVVSNIRKYVGGMSNLSPFACLDDGEMELWLFDGDSPLDSLRTLGLVLSNVHQHSKNVRCIPFKHLKMVSERPLFFQVDGDPVKTKDKVKIDVEHLAINILVPSKYSNVLFEKPGKEWIV